MKCQEFVLVEGLQINLKILKAVAFLSLCIIYKHGLKPFEWCVCETWGKLKCVLNIQCWWKKYNSYKPTKPACQELMQETADHFWCEKPGACVSQWF